MSESAVSAKPLLLYGLARNRRSPKRPSEPRPSGLHPEGDAVKKRQPSFPLENDEWNGFGKFLVRHKSGILRKTSFTGETILTKDKRKIRFVSLRQENVD